MPASTSLVQPDAHLTPLARLVLHTVTGVPMRLLNAVRVKPASSNWLHAPWYGYHRGGAITVGRTIWFSEATPDGYSPVGSRMNQPAVF